MSTPRRRAAAAATVVAALTLTGTGCSSDDTAGPSSSPDRAPVAGGKVAHDRSGPVETRVTLSSVTGRLGGQKRQRLKANVSRLVDAWFEAAYLGDYPRRDFSDAFPGFSSGAREQARGDLALMSNKTIGERVESVAATRRRARLDVLAVRGRSAGVTARVVLDYATTGEVQRSERVKGRLFLALRDGKWQVFGYDMTKGRIR